MATAVLALNALVSLASASLAAVAIARPGALSRSDRPSPGETYFARLYAFRAVPFEAAAGIAPFTGHSTVVVALLAVAAGVQVADAFLGLSVGIRSMVAGGSLAAAVHLACALAIR